ncbi:hypothetical protein A7A08_01716 [Methyloligella halotolerans]|uniref:Fibronectin type-III domain-containing protein n=1 Tax=Methyloligella halotolerans TaxID=1177755 RepID=A0A1E2RZP2_9HYPH|nr:phage tail protein [Methyloligella halotolerans]ODA67681.1 hypothetical protein A7A08_01716 [Methyloligella halotolerans]
MPQSLIVGRAVTAGSRVYAETYGKRGPTDNSDLVEIIAIADHPCEGLVKVFVEEAAATLEGTGATQTVAGYDDKLSIRFLAGNQTQADSYTVDKLFGHSRRPWTDDMVGRGIAYARAHYVYDAEKIYGPLPWRFVVDGAKLYDPRKDSTVAGGSGSHRWNDLSTHEWSANLAVIAYNILRGIRVADADGIPRHFYGIEGTPASALPLDNWFAAMNEADLEIDGEPQFHGGAEIGVNVEPHETLQSLLRACGGRLVENGGVWKIYMGPPGLPVASITDGDLRADQEDVFRPILPLEQRVNYLTAQFTDSRTWLPRVAPPRRDEAAEARDGRRISADLDVPWVQSVSHVQRLQKQLLARSRQERRHTIPLGPEHWGLEPGDVIAWTSAANGYDNKHFEIEAVEDDHDFNITVSVIEVDPDDYEWDAETDFVEVPVIVPTTDFPAAQEVPDFAVEGAVIATGPGGRRAAIYATWTDPENADLESVIMEVRPFDEPDNIWEVRSDDPPSQGRMITAGIEALTTYQVRAYFYSRNGYAVEKTGWISVLTPEAGIDIVDLSDTLQARNKQLDIASGASLARGLLAAEGRLDQLSITLLEMLGTLDAQDQAYQQVTGAVIDSNLIEVKAEAISRAKALQLLVAEVDDDVNALAQAFTAVFAQSEHGDAAALFRLIAQATPSEVLARIALEVKSESSEFGANSAGLYLDVYEEIGTVAQIIAERFLVSQPDAEGGDPKPAFGVSNVNGTPTITLLAELVADNLIKARMIEAYAITSDKINAQAVTADKVAAGAITAGKLAARAVSADKIAARTITVDEIKVGTLPDPGSSSGSFEARSSTYETVASVTVDIDSSVRGLLLTAQTVGTVYWNNPGSDPVGRGRARARLVVGGTGEVFELLTDGQSDGSFVTLPLLRMLTGGQIPTAGSRTVTLQVSCPPSGGAPNGTWRYQGSGYLGVLVNRA